MTRAKDISKIITDADFSGTLEITKGASGASANAAADELVLQNSGDAGLSILSPNANNSQILLGSPVANAGGIIRWTGNDNAVKIGTNNTGSTLRFHVGGFSEVMRISSAGNVGIGTSSPDTTTQISKSTTSTDGSVYPTLKIENTSAGTGNSYARFQVNGGNDTTTFTLLADGRSSNSDVSLRTNTSTPMSFYTNGSERMRVTSNGNLAIGTTTEYAKLHVTSQGNVTTPALFEDTTTGTSSVTAVVLKRNGSNVGAINTTNTSTAYVTSSDHRLKENVVEMTDATTRLKQLQPKRFNFIADEDTTVDGFLAHEVQSVVPEAITGTHNEVDADGNPVYQGIDQSKLVPLLVKTIQELEARIVALETA